VEKLEEAGFTIITQAVKLLELAEDQLARSKLDATHTAP
jgi:hypothetical protein